MARFSQLEEAFFQRGEQLTEMVEDARPTGWFDRLFGLTQWPALIEPDPGDYLSYEVIYETDYVSREMAA